MTTKIVTLEITTSTHPEFDLFASVMINGHQVARRGDRAEIDAFTSEVIQAGEQTGVAVKIADETKPACPTCGDTAYVSLWIPGRAMGGGWVAGATQKRCRTGNHLLSHVPDKE